MFWLGLIITTHLLANGQALAQPATAPSGTEAPAADASRPVTPAEWIWHSSERRGEQRAVFRKSFRVAASPPSAQLWCVADFCHLELRLNGQPIAKLEPYGERLQREVASDLRVGANVLTVACRAVEGPSAFFLHLQWVDAQGNIQKVVSDSSWKTAERPEPGWREADFAEEGWSDPAVLGRVAPEPWGMLREDIRISPFDDYTQWKQAIDAEQGTDPATFQALPGFTVTQLHSATDQEGSWVSMAFDPRGRLVVAREERGLLRITLPADDRKPPRVETIDDTLEECRGLLFAHRSLYANANNSKALYRLRDTTGDDRFDRVEKLLATSGGVGHGRNDLALGPDGMIYSIHGDSVDIPRDAEDLTSPFRAHRRGQPTREGHVVRLDPEGKRVEVLAAGLRNPFGIDFHPDGEMFTYDADAEFDMGAPWYRPTRVDHITPGADFGWRGVTGSWPPYFPDHPDNTPPTLDIGKGSPTAVMFGTRSAFPPRYRRALFILDWAYGRILAVHLTPRGAGYAGRAESFLRGRPLNVTDLAFGPDGAMYFITGGRGTQSALYRVAHGGNPATVERPSRQQSARATHAAAARTLRRRLETFLHFNSASADPSRRAEQQVEAFRAAWPLLGHPDPRLRDTARLVVEHLPLESWSERALEEPSPATAVTALLALARGGRDDVRTRVLRRLTELPLHHVTDGQLLSALHAYRLSLSDDMAAWNELPEDVRQDTLGKLRALYPHARFQVNRSLSRLLARLDGPQAIAPTLALLRAAEEPTERLHYLFVLRSVAAGWSLEQRRAYFEALNDLGGIVGGQGMPGFLRQIREDAQVTLTDAEKEALADELRPPGDEEQPLADFAARPHVRKWRPKDIADHLADGGQRPDHAAGARVFQEALCGRCHRLGAVGRSVGPDLTSVSRRFSPRDMLTSILEPSRVVAENYRTARVVMTDGKVLAGHVRSGDDYRDPALHIVPDLLRPATVVKVPKSEIEQHEWSPTSPMPAGLLDSFRLEEILELLAYLEAGGDPDHPLYADRPE